MENAFWIPLQLSFRSYIPKTGLRTGMMFLKNVNGEPFVFLLERVPVDQEQWIKDVGYPIEPYIVNIDEHTDVEEVIVEPDNIGWFDEGEFTDELVDIECRHLNRILSGYDGFVELEMMDEEGNEENLVPVIYEGKVTLRYPEFEEHSNDYTPDESSFL